MKQSNTKQQARKFIGLAAKFRTLQETAGESRVRAFWDIQARIVTTASADCWDGIEEFGPFEYETALKTIGKRRRGRPADPLAALSKPPR